MIGFLQVALAATPTPDRPSVSASPTLVAARTAEVEVGAYGDPTSLELPVLLKVGLGAIEPRVGISPLAKEVSPQLKLRLGAGTAAFAVLDPGFRSGSLHLLTGAALGPTSLTVNAGVQVDPGVGLALPVAAALGGNLTDTVSVFGELATVLDPLDRPQIIVDGGVGWLVHPNIALDAGVGWTAGAPFFNAGAVINLGR